MSKIKVAVVGCGSISKHRHIPEYALNQTLSLLLSLTRLSKELNITLSFMAEKLTAAMLKC